MKRLLVALLLFLMVFNYINASYIINCKIENNYTDSITLIFYFRDTTAHTMIIPNTNGAEYSDYLQDYSEKYMTHFLWRKCSSNEPKPGWTLVTINLNNAGPYSFASGPDYGCICWSPKIDKIYGTYNGAYAYQILSLSNIWSFSSASVIPIGIQSNLSLGVVSLYTGSDIQWYIRKKDGTDTYLKSGKSVSISAFEIARIVGAYGLFRVYPKTPEYKETEGMCSFDNVYATQDNYGLMRIDPEPLEGLGDVLCGKNITFTYNSNLARTFHWFIGQYGINGMVWDSLGYSTNNSGTNTQSIPYSVAINHIADISKPIFIRATCNTDSFTYAISKGNVSFLPSPPTYTYSTIGACPDMTNGSITIKPDTVGKQIYNFFIKVNDTMQAIYCSNITHLDFLYGETALKRSNFCADTFYTQGYWLTDTAGNDTLAQVCPTGYTQFVIPQYKKPVLSTRTPVSPSCVNRTDGQIIAFANDINLSDTMRYYLNDSLFSTNTSNDSVTAKMLTPNVLYRIKAKDGFGCENDSNSVTITPTYPIDFDVDVENPKCYGGNDGSVSAINAQGGPVGSNYRYKLGAEPWVNNPVFISQLAGTKTISVALSTDTNCLTTKDTALIQPQQLLLDSIKKSVYGSFNVGCRIDNLGHITLYGSGGTGMYSSNYLYNTDTTTYSVNDSTTIPSLPAGNYVVWLHDTNNCISQKDSVSMIGPPEIYLADTLIIPERCPKTNDGSIYITPAGGSGNYTSFVWRDSTNVQVTDSLNLKLKPAGRYSVEITDSLGCSNSLNVLLPAAKQVNINAFTISPTCIGYSNGSLTLNGLTNGLAPYTYEFNNESGTVLPNSFYGLKDSTYTLTVRDSSYLLPDNIYKTNCTYDFAITVLDKDSVKIMPKLTNVKCFGESTGSIAIAPIIGPDSPFVYAWFNETDSISNNRDSINVPKGKYRVMLLDSLNCETNFSGFLINEPDRLLFKIVNIDSASCQEVGNGSITIEATGGTEDYYYSVDSGYNTQSNASFPYLYAGAYKLAVLDSNSCRIDTAVRVEAGQINLQLTDSNNASCFGFNDGLIELNATGGNGYYQYSINNGTNYSFLNQFNVSAGTFSTLAREVSSKCLSDTMVITITEPARLNITILQVDSSACKQALGAIKDTLTGGSGDYTFYWSRSENGNEGTKLTGLYADTYRLVLRDKNSTTDCLTDTFVEVPDRTAPKISSIDVVSPSWCSKALGTLHANVINGSAPIQYSWNDSLKQTTSTASNLKAKKYTVTVRDFYGCADSTSYILIDGPMLLVSAITTNSACNNSTGSASITVNGGVQPYSYQWPESIPDATHITTVVDSLSSGIYLLTITDSVGCNKNYTLSISDTNGPVIQSISGTKSWCSLPTGTATVTATNGIMYNWFINGSTSVISNEQFVANLFAGDYIAQVLDSIGCKSSNRITIADSAELKPELGLLHYDNPACGKPLGKIVVQLTGGLLPYFYNWQTSPIITDSVLNNVIAGEYTNIATDSRGCKDTLTIQLVDKRNPEIAILAKENAYCGMPNGKVLLAGQYGTLPYSVYNTVEPGVTFTTTYNDSLLTQTALIDSLLPNTPIHFFTLVDSNLCSSDTIGVVILDNNPMKASIANILPVKCYRESNGTVAIIASNGIEPYSYEWSSAQVDSAINTKLPVGNGSCTILDKIGCRVVKYYSISQPSDISIQNSYIEDPTCHNDCNGRIQTFITGGAGSLNYSWSNGNSGPSGINFCPGNIILIVTDTSLCTKKYSFEINNTPALTGTNLPDSASVCSGQAYILDPGTEWNNCTWTSNNGFSITGNTAEVSETGIYYLQAYSTNGCEVRDSINLLVSNSLLNAEFLMASEANIGDTVVIIDISWPLPENYTWNLPEESKSIISTDDFREIIFNTPGTYYIELSAKLANCTSVTGKYIEVLDATLPGEKDKAVEKPDLISKFNVYPNPVYGRLNMSIELSEKKDIRVEVIDVSAGILYQSILDYGMDKYEINMNVERLKTGVYLLKLISGNKVKTKTIIVHK
jgi:hypothetical protein